MIIEFPFSFPFSSPFINHFRVLLLPAIFIATGLFSVFTQGSILVVARLFETSQLKTSFPNCWVARPYSTPDPSLKLTSVLNWRAAPISDRSRQFYFSITFCIQKLQNSIKITLTCGVAAKRKIGDLFCRIHLLLENLK